MLKSLEDVWLVLDAEYGDPKELTAQRLGDLHNFCYTEDAKTDGEKLLELHQVWREIYTDLQVIGALGKPRLCILYQ